MGGWGWHGDGRESESESVGVGVVVSLLERRDDGWRKRHGWEEQTMERMRTRGYLRNKSGIF